MIIKSYTKTGNWLCSSHGRQYPAALRRGCLFQEFGHTVVFYFRADINPELSHIYAIAYLLANLMVGIFFWWRADWMAHRIAGKYSNYEIHSNIKSEDIRTTGFMVVGLYVMAQAIRPFGNCFEIIINAITDPAALKIYMNNSKTFASPFIRTASWLAWGLLIFFGAPWLTRISKKFIGDK